MTVDEARLRAHRHAMRTDPDYRAVMNRITTERLATWVQKKKRESTRRMWSIDQLPMPRCYMHGPRWRRAFDVKEVPIADLVPPHEVSWHRPGRKLLVFTLEPDVRELVCEPIRGDVYAMWSDPTERWGR